MRIVLEVAALLLAAVTLSLTLAHALELPGKMKLARDEYLAVQRIYYPGFTIGGVCEPLTVVALAALLLATPAATTQFLLLAAALVAAAATHAIYWLVTAPVNKAWVQGQTLPPAAEHFFGKGQGPQVEWQALRNRWEGSHLARAATASVAFLLAVATAIAG